MAFDPHVPEIAGVDRRRELEERGPAMPPAELPSAREELTTIARRIRFVYLSIVVAVISALFIWR